MKLRFWSGRGNQNVEFPTRFLAHRFISAACSVCFTACLCSLAHWVLVNMVQTGDSKLTAEESAKLRHFIAAHFSSREEFHHFFLTLSIVLIVAGIILMILGRRLMKRRTQVTPVSGSV